MNTRASLTPMVPLERTLRSLEALQSVLGFSRPFVAEICVSARNEWEIDFGLTLGTQRVDNCCWRYDDDDPEDREQDSDGTAMPVHGADAEDEKQGCGSTRCPPYGELEYLDLLSVRREGQLDKEYTNAIGHTAYSVVYYISGPESCEDHDVIHSPREVVGDDRPIQSGPLYTCDLCRYGQYPVIGKSLQLLRQLPATKARERTFTHR